MVLVKITFIKRRNIESRVFDATTLEDVLEKCRECFQEKQFSLTYEDDQNSWITVSTPEEWTIATETLDSSESLKRLNMRAIRKFKKHQKVVTSSDEEGEVSDSDDHLAGEFNPRKCRFQKYFHHFHQPNSEVLDEDKETPENEESDANDEKDVKGEKAGKFQFHHHRHRHHHHHHHQMPHWGRHHGFPGPCGGFGPHGRPHGPHHGPHGFGGPHLGPHGFGGPHHGPHGFGGMGSQSQPGFPFHFGHGRGFGMSHSPHHGHGFGMHHGPSNHGFDMHHGPHHAFGMNHGPSHHGFGMQHGPQGDHGLQGCPFRSFQGEGPHGKCSKREFRKMMRRHCLKKAMKRAFRESQGEFPKGPFGRHAHFGGCRFGKGPSHGMSHPYFGMEGEN